MGDPADILVIDDDPRLCATVGDVLQHRGHRVRTAHRGREALAQLVRQPADLAIVDFKLPDVSGVDLLKRIKATSPETAVILISGHASLSSALEAINREADSYLVKPLDAEQLVGSVDRALAKQCSARELRESEGRYRLVSESMTESISLLSSSIDDTARRIADSVLGLFKAQLVVLYRLDSVSGGLTAVALSIPSLCSSVALHDGAALHPAAGFAVSQGRPVVYPDILDDARVPVTPGLLRMAEQMSFRSVLAVPLVVKDRAVGVLGIGGPAGRAFGAQDVQLARAYADHAAIVLENERLYRTLKASQERLVEAERLQALGALTSGVTNYVNNVLQALLGRVQLVLQKLDQPALVQDLEVSERTILEAGQVLRRLRRFCEVRPLTAEPMDLNRLVMQAVEVSRGDREGGGPAGRPRLEIVSELSDIPKVAGQPMALLEVVSILLANAVEARGGRITIRTWQAEGAVHCAVEDSGIGMSEDVRRRAMDPFFTTKGPERNGLGLSVAYGIIRRHQGEIEIASVEGAGTRVTLRLPSVAPA